MSVGILIPIILFGGGIALAMKLTNIALAGLVEIRRTAPQRKK